MEIELRKIYISRQFSEETVAFTANLWIDGRKVGYASNDGKGGCTNYEPDHPDDRDTLRAAEEYCKTLPPWKLDDTTSIPMNLEHFIDRKIDEYANMEERKRFQRKMEKSMAAHIVFGIPGADEFKSYPTSAPIVALLSSESGQQLLSNEIQQVVTAFIKPGEQILNTNIPSELRDLSIYKKEGQQQERKIHPQQRKGNPPKLT
ncbi:hypothetical protein [Chitinophaga defluvii]|uniref:Uncharacterized protein n=1 Tax=Chitinophaga defluvii TaxID=3163343 RepID=A0ABV2T9R9_9BACT